MSRINSDMKYIMVAILAGSGLFIGGCASFLVRQKLIGGSRIMYYPAGTSVPCVDANDNKNGWYSITAEEFDGILNK